VVPTTHLQLFYITTAADLFQTFVDVLRSSDMKASHSPFDGNTSQDLYIQPSQIRRGSSSSPSNDDTTGAEAEADASSHSELTDGSSDNRTVQERRVLPKDKRLMKILRRGEYKGLPGGLTYHELAKKYKHSANNVLKQYRLSIKRVYGEQQGQSYLDEEAAERQAKKDLRAHGNAAREAKNAELEQKRVHARAKKADTQKSGRRNERTVEGGQASVLAWLNARSLDDFVDDNHQYSYEQWLMPTFEPGDLGGSFRDVTMTGPPPQRPSELDAIPRYQLDLLQHRRDIEELLSTSPPSSESWESSTASPDGISAFDLAFNHNSEGKDDERVAVFDSVWPETPLKSLENWRSSSSWWA